jgi:hypothetical protein
MGGEHLECSERVSSANPRPLIESDEKISKQSLGAYEDVERFLLPSSSSCLAFTSIIVELRRTISRLFAS